MLDLILIVLLVLGILVGLKRGLILQVVHLAGFVLAYIVAYHFSADLAPNLKWIPYPNLGEGSGMVSFFSGIHAEDAYYRAIAFLILFFGTKILANMLGSMLNLAASIPVLKQINKLAGGIFGFAEVYLVLFILLFAAGLLPMNNVQSALKDSSLTGTIVNHTPVLSDKVKELWLQYGSGKTTTSL